MSAVDLTPYEFACLISKVAKDIGSWGEQNLIYDAEAIGRIAELSRRLAKLSDQYLKDK